MPRIIQRPAARRDLIGHFVFIAGTANEETARGFLESAERTFEELAKMPKMGVSRSFRNPNFADVRMWRVKSFEKFLIFYRPVKDGIVVLRVIHGSRDIENLFNR